MEIMSLFSHNLLSPPILFFVLGIFAGFIKSDLEVPEQISHYLSIYLMMSIGFKGGVAIAQTPEINPEVIMTIITGVLFAFLQPFIGYFFLKKTTKLDSPTAAAVAAHYGSVSMVTFITATTFLNAHHVMYAGYIVAILALMEAPPILSGLFIAHRSAPETIEATEKATPKLWREIFTNGSILLLIGAFVIGLLTGKTGLDQVSGFFVIPFQGILTLFMLDMGLLVSRELHHLQAFNFRLAVFGIYMPILGAAIGLMSSKLIGLDLGTGMLFTVLCASASYIAVPAAMHLALPKAKPAIYLPMSLGITFPLNIMLGIPIYYALANRFLN